MDKILAGVVHFHDTLHPDELPEFARLVKDGQAPRALFITCADSRIVPNTLTNTGPGDIFLIRNIGNLVPSYASIVDGAGDTSVAAALEYSLNVLKIKNIILCGHSDCGAMKAVQRFRELPEGSPLRNWLSNGEEALTELLAGHAVDQHLVTHDQLAQLNVLAQLQRLKEYPIVQQKLEAGEVILHGWFLQIENASVHAFHPGRNRFVHIDAEAVKELLFLDRVFAKTPSVRMHLHDPDMFK
jgi:carbonic anhydrase